MPRVDSTGCPVSNMDEIVFKREDEELVAYDCYGEVAYRIPSFKPYQTLFNFDSWQLIRARSSAE